MKSLLLGRALEQEVMKLFSNKVQDVRFKKFLLPYISDIAVENSTNITGRATVAASGTLAAKLRHAGRAVRAQDGAAPIAP
jgi:hypothetical protein